MTSEISVGVISSDLECAKPSLVDCGRYRVLDLACDRAIGDQGNAAPFVQGLRSTPASCHAGAARDTSEARHFDRCDTHVHFNKVEDVGHEYDSSAT